MREHTSHAKFGHNHGQASSAEAADGDLCLDVGELALAAAARGEDAHVGQFLEHKILVPDTEGVGGFESGELVGQLPERAGKAIVLGVVVALLHAIPSHDVVLAVIAVALVCLEVDLAEQLLLMVLQRATHGGADVVMYSAQEEICRKRALPDNRRVVDERDGTQARRRRSGQVVETEEKKEPSTPA